MECWGGILGFQKLHIYSFVRTRHLPNIRLGIRFLYPPYTHTQADGRAVVVWG